MGQPTFIANELTFNPLPMALIDPITLVDNNKFYDTGRYGPAPVVSGPVNERSNVTYTGVDGTQQVDKGFRMQQIFATLVWTGAGDGGVAQALANAISDMNTLYSNTRYTISVGGQSIDGCKVANWGQPSWVTIANGVLYIVPVIFQNLGSGNYGV